MKTAILLVSHGSHSPKTKEEVQGLVRDLKHESNISIFEFAFLEIESPSITEGIDSCVNQGAQRVLVLLNFLNSGKHVDEDIPLIVQEAQKKCPKVHIDISPPVGQHANIKDIFLEMIQ